MRIEKETIPSKIRGKFRLRDEDATNPIAVGDKVSIRLNEDDTGLITAIHPRRNKLSRRAAGRRVGKEHVIVANVDAAFVMQSIRLPKPNAGFIDRFLVMAAYHELEAGIILNKIDLTQQEDKPFIDDFCEMYREAGYTVFLTSAKTGQGIEELKQQFRDKVTVLSGPSGVGKSTIMNACSPDLNLPIGEVSKKTRKGKHTTTHAALFPINNDSYVVDTPGIREYGLMDIVTEELAHYFPEFLSFLNECRFPNCVHDHEPDCAVKNAVDDNIIHPSRYRSYLNMLDSLNLGEKDVGR